MIFVDYLNGYKSYLFISSKMACMVNWSQILDGHYPSYKVEVLAYLDSLDISSSTEIVIEYIYEKIKSDADVCDNLKLLYQEAVFGHNKGVKKG